MKLHHALALVPLLALTACGGSDGSVFTLNTGTYTLSSVSAVAPDNCNLADTFPDGTQILVTVANGSATTSLSGASTPQHDPVSTISDNSIADGTKTYDVLESSTCTQTITLTLGGEILADNQFSGTLKYSAQSATGSAGCTASSLQYKAFPCASTITFTAKKQ